MGDVGQIELTACDVTNPRAIAAALVGAEALVNLVGILSEAGRQTFDAVQADAPAAIAQAAAAPERGAASFSCRPSARTPAPPPLYARTKAEGEAAVRAAVPTATMLRPSIVFGPEDDFFNRFAAMAALSPALPLIGGGETRFQPVYAGDVGAAVAAALRSRRSPPAAPTSWAGPRCYSFRELMEIMLGEIHLRRALVPLPFPIASAMGSVRCSWPRPSA